MTDDPGARVSISLYCSDLDRSVLFFEMVLGFRLVERDEGDSASQSEVTFEYESTRIRLIQLPPIVPGVDAYTTMNRLELAVADVPEQPYGRGAVIELLTLDVRSLIERIVTANWRPYSWPLFLGERETWRPAGETYRGTRFFAVQVPDGYVLRFSQDLGTSNDPPRL